MEVDFAVHTVMLMRLGKLVLIVGMSGFRDARTFAASNGNVGFRRNRDKLANGETKLLALAALQPAYSVSGTHGYLLFHGTTASVCPLSTICRHKATSDWGNLAVTFPRKAHSSPET